MLALGGRLEIKDWIDSIYASKNIQHLAFLIYAACGKDPGFSPMALLNEAGRSARYSFEEFNTELVFEAETPDFSELTRQWKSCLAEAKEIVKTLPAKHAGECVLDSNLTLYEFSTMEELAESVRRDKLFFHQGRIKGVWPTVSVDK